MKSVLQLLSLSDRYERKARLLPGLIVALAPAITAATAAQDLVTWYTAIGAGIGVELVLAFGLGLVARAAGRRIEDFLWESWGGPTTTRWLRPSDTTCSDQQKTRWRSAIKHMTGLTLPATMTPSRTPEDVDRLIRDATKQLRYAIRERPEARMVAVHNEDYGFARNLLGLRWLWIGLAALSLVVGTVLLGIGNRAMVAPLLVSGLSLLIGGFAARALPTHVRQCADRYAESLLATALLCTAASASGPTATNQKVTSPSEVPAGE
ncbi:MAG: hypothetical protein ACLP9L_11375 [Thermoguttaceae bacterium]